ncbi:MAG: phosphate ABC transporter ATP-binding protein PstB [Chloroflexota bacterium]|nr:phosphate ABC transporter ATP-binding protein PstB [Chloroflexota bacterium]MDE2942170.1 phosphate ABC transporter ATP-binding protein PstB [Chloroflexota bacterium]MDE3267998.1 phosphate ABC transporter ATP-binding protein PstB [Chloroflexota bacterium]
MVTENFLNLPQTTTAEAAVEPARDATPESVIDVRELQAYYGENRALKDISLSLYSRRVSAIIGPSGCGKSTLVRCLNRMHEMSSGGHVKGEVLYQGENIYGAGVDPVELRSRIGMVFQKPNPFPKSIFENVAFGLKVNGISGNTSERVERSLRRAALWDEVKDRLKQSALQLSGGQQQRLCIARALAVEPEVILMDEPCSALDPMATLAVEELIRELSQEVTIIIVTHNMQQAARVSHHTAFLMMDQDKAGYLVEYGPTSEVFTNPKSEHTEAYITGRFS